MALPPVDLWYRKQAVWWPQEHWHVAVFACACVLIVAALLVDQHVLTVRAALAAAAASVVYVLLTTWQYTHDRDADK